MYPPTSPLTPQSVVFNHIDNSAHNNLIGVLLALVLGGWGGPLYAPSGNKLLLLYLAWGKDYRAFDLILPPVVSYRPYYSPDPAHH